MCLPVVAHRQVKVFINPLELPKQGRLLYVANLISNQAFKRAHLFHSQ